MANFKREASAFLRLWLFMFFSFLMVNLAFDLIYRGWIDLTHVAILKLFYIPLGQAAAFWFLTRGRRDKAVA